MSYQISTGQSQSCELVQQGLQQAVGPPLAGIPLSVSASGKPGRPGVERPNHGIISRPRPTSSSAPRANGLAKKEATPRTGLWSRSG
jgi:hypothetical protein